MQRKKRLLLVLFLATTSTGSFAEENPVRKQVEPQSQAVLFVTPLLSEAEQADYRAKIRAASDASERERIRAAHYELMKVRAKERGRALPDSRPAAVGEAGNAFGPELTAEEQRAAQRARSRSAGKRPPDATIRPVGGEPAVDKKTSADLPERAAVGNKPAGEVTLDRGRPAMKPDSPPAKAAEPVFGNIALPGMDAIFGPELMSEAEKAAFRARLRSARSDGERQAIRTERDEQMRARAKEKGVTLPQ
jgi:hypothetical protein